MNLYTTDGILLYATESQSLQKTIEHAIKDGVILDRIDLKNKDLRNINFDTVIMRGACLQNSDLSGANISETICDHSDFTNTQLYNTCLAYASLKSCCFNESLFGGTDLSESTIDDSIFEGVTTFSLPFKTVRSMKRVSFIHNQKTYAMENTPIHITGYENDINIIDHHILIKDEIFSHQELEHYKSIPTKKNDHLLFYNKMIQLSKRQRIT